MCRLYSHTCHVCFLGLLPEGKCCFGVSPFLFFVCLFYLFSWFVLFFFFFPTFVMLDEEQADWTLLASAVPSSCLKDDSRFPFFLMYSTLPNINSYFIPGSSTIFYDNSQIVFGLLSTLKFFTHNNKYDLWIWNFSCVFSGNFGKRLVPHKMYFNYSANPLLLYSISISWS